MAVSQLKLIKHCVEFVPKDEVRELEGIFRHIYRKDNRANRLNLQRSFKKLSKVRQATKKEGWMKGSGGLKKVTKKQKK